MKDEQDSQLQLIKDHLLRGRSITQKEAVSWNFRACWRLSSVIHRLREDHNLMIRTEMVPDKNGKHAKYFIDENMEYAPAV